MSCWHCGSILVSHTRGGYVVGSSHFTVITNSFVRNYLHPHIQKSQKNAKSVLFSLFAFTQISSDSPQCYTCSTVVQVHSWGILSCILETGSIRLINHCFIKKYWPKKGYYEPHICSSYGFVSTHASHHCCHLHTLYFLY